MLFGKSRCYNGGNQHKFTPRYTELPNNEIKIKRTRGNAGPGEIRKLLYYDVYLFDICEWCGKKIKK